MPEHRIPAEVFPPGEYIADELKARGWTEEDLARRMPGEYGLNLLSVQMVLSVHDKNLLLGDDMAFALGQAFEVNPRVFINLDRMWRGLPSLDNNQ